MRDDRDHSSVHAAAAAGTIDESTASAAALSTARHVLGAPALTADDDLFDAGMTSLSALRLADRLSEAFGREVTVTDVYLAGDIAGILRLHAAAGPAPSGTVPPRPDGDLVPLSHAQERFWLAEQFAPGAADNMLVLAYAIDGRLDSERLRVALLDVIGRHPALRTRYPWVETGAVAQTVSPEAVDLSLETVAAPFEPADEAGRQALAEAVTADWWETPLDLAERPPLRLRLCPIGADQHLLCLQIHHIAFDGRSEQIFVTDLLAAYRQFDGEEADREAPPPEEQHDPRAEPDADEDLVYWSRSLTNAPRPFLPAPPDAADEASRAEICWLVATDTVSGIRAVAQRRRLPTLALLLAAAARALAEVFPVTDLALGTLSDRRGPGAPDSAIGYFVNPVPVVLTSVTQRDLPDLLEHAASGVLAGLRHSRIPFDELVRRLGPERGRHPWFQAWVVLQYPVPEGELVPGTRLRAVRVRPPRTAAELSVEAFPRTDGSWELRLIWRNDGCARDDVRAVGDRIRTLLDEIAGQDR